MKKQISFFIVPLLILSTLTFTACNNSKTNSPTEKVSLHASWDYSYANTEELAKCSDLIAFISIKEGKAYRYGTVPMTSYTAEIKDLIYGDKANEVSIVMTGGILDNTVYEVDDDPLMTNNDEFIVFARKNDDGTYAILGGPQGRFVVKNNSVSSMNVTNKQIMQANTNTNINVNNMPLSDFINEVSSYVKK